MDSLRAQTLNRDHSTDPPNKVDGLLDINVLPDRYQRRRISFTTIFAWLLFVALVGLLYLSFQRFQQGTRTLAEQRLRFQTVQEALDAAEAQPAEIEQLQTDIDTLQERPSVLEAALAMVNIQPVQWGSLLAEIVLAAPDDVRITTLSQNADLVNIVGVADEYDQPLAYRDDLKAQGMLFEVRLVSITRVAAEDLEQLLEEAPTPAEQPEEVEATNEEDAQNFLYQFEIQLRVPEAVQATPTPEVTE